jgi:uroporphyrinogen decarboxylase
MQTSSLRRAQPDFSQFLRVLRREGKPVYLPFYEHFASSGFIARATGKPFDRLTMKDPDYWPTYVDFWLDLGFDCIPMELGPILPVCPRGGGGAASHGSESGVMIRSLDDFEAYEWPPDEFPIDFGQFETVEALLPEGVKIVGGVSGGPYEWATVLMGVMGLSYALVDAPDLVRLVFERLGRLYRSAHRQLAAMEGMGALRQGDDLGFKTATFLSPDDLRRYVFPIYRTMVDAAHGQGKPFILHSCGNLNEVYDDLIACGIDAKHSFEDAILPVHDFKKQYGDRITPLGGLDVDVICRGSEEMLRRYTRRMIEACWTDGYWALGTGNSLTDYMPVENYRIVLQEGMQVSGAI